MADEDFDYVSAAQFAASAANALRAFDGASEVFVGVLRAQRDLDSLNGKIEGVQKILDDLDVEHTKRVLAYEEELSKLAEKRAQVVSEVRDEISSLKKSAQTELDEISKKIESATKRYGQLVASYDQDIEIKKAEVYKVESQLNELERKLADLKTGLGKL